jgi:Phage integrase, N-terminal SAM-like domain
VTEYVVDWLAAIEPTVRPATHFSYTRNLNLHVVPRIGSVPLRRVDDGTLNGLYAALLAEGKRTGRGRPLAAHSPPRPHDPAPGVPRRGALGPARTQSGRRIGPA